MSIKISALRISQDRYVCVSSLSVLRAVLFDPIELYDTNNQKVLDANPRLRAAKEQRGENQRAFNPARKHRATQYADYIQNVDNEIRKGGYPTITIWCKEALEFITRSEDFEYGLIVLDGHEILTANDGETQLAARFMLGRLDPLAMNKPFAFTLKTDSNAAEAMQTLHDMNHYATPVSEKETAALNIEGPLTKAINLGIAESGVNTRRIQSRGDAPNKKSANVTTMMILLHGAIGALNGKEDWVHDRSPARQLNDANGQYASLNGGTDRIVGFISQVLRLPDDVLKGITFAHMLALGIVYAKKGSLPVPLSPESYDIVVAQLRSLMGASAKSKINTKELVKKLVEVIK